MKRAFTILELLAATALTALLMVVVLRIIGSLGLSRAAMARQPATDAALADLLDVLRRDLTDASTASFRPDGMILAGHGALGRATLSRLDEPVNVTYGLATIHGRRWLIRTQAPRDGASNEPGWSELVWPDVTRFIVRPAGVLRAPAEATADANASETLPPMVSVSIDGPNGKIVNEIVVLR